MNKDKFVNGKKILPYILKELYNTDTIAPDKEFELLKNLKFITDKHEKLKRYEDYGAANKKVSVLNHALAAEVAAGFYKKRKGQNKKGTLNKKPLTYNEGKDSFENNIINFKITEDANYVKTIYYQIIERLCINAQIFYHLINILSTFLELVSTNWKTNKTVEQEKLNNIKENYDDLDELMQAYFIDLKNDEPTPLSRIFTLANSANFYFYKKYCHQKDIKLEDGLKVDYTPIGNIPFTYNEYIYNPYTDRFANSVNDIYRIKYDSAINVSDIDKNFNSIIAQPLRFRKINGSGSTILEVFNSQELSTNSGIKDSNEPHDVIKNKGYLKNVNITSSAQFEPDIYLPNFTNYKIPYSTGLIKNLKNITLKYNTDIIKYSSISEPLPLDEQITQTEKLIKMYSMGAIKRCIRINNISFDQSEQDPIRCTYIKIIEVLMGEKVSSLPKPILIEKNSNIEDYQEIFGKIKILLNKFISSDDEEGEVIQRNPFIEYTYIKKRNKLIHSTSEYNIFRPATSLTPCPTPIAPSPPPAPTASAAPPASTVSAAPPAPAATKVEPPYQPQEPAAIDAAPTNVLMEEKSLDLKPVPYWKDNKLYLITIKNFYNGMREKESIMEIWDDMDEQRSTSGVDDILTPVKLQQVWTNLLSLSKKMPADILDVLENPDNKPWPTHNASHVVKISLHGEQTSGHLSLDNQSKIITLLGPEFKGIVNNLKIQFIEESDVALKEGDTDSTWITLAIQYLYLNRTVQSGGTVLQSTTKLKRDYNFIIDPKTKKSIKSNSKRGEAIIMGYMRNSDSLFF